MKGFEYYRARMHEGIEEFFSEQEKGEGFGIKGSLKDLFYSRRNSAQRIKAILTLIHRVLPGIVPDKKIYQDKFFKEENLPFDLENYKFERDFIGKGGESCVFLLRSLVEGKESIVLKINKKRNSSTEGLLQEAKRIKEEYERVKEWYEDELPGFIPEELTIISPGARGEERVIITIQKFIAGEIKDLFSDFSQEELVELLKNNSQLREDFKKFFLATKKKERETGEMIDMFGEKNLSIVEGEKGEKKLIFLDPHVIFSRIKRGQETRKRMQEKLNYLEAVFREAEETEVAA